MIALFCDGDFVCGTHQQLSCIALYCSAAALLELLVVRFVLITANLARFFQPDYIALFTQITLIFPETD